VLWLLCCINASATHTRGGQILVKRVSNDQSDRKYKIIIQAYIDSESSVPFGGSDLDVLAIFGRNHSVVKIQVPEITMNTPYSTYTIIDAARHVARVEFIYEYEFPGNDVYTIAYTELNRNAGVLNFSNSISSPFYIETKIVIDDFAGSETPTNLESPIFFGVAGKPFSFCVGAFDPNVELSYTLIAPKAGPTTNVENFSIPENFHINPYTGLVTWDGNFNGIAQAGEFGFAVQISGFKDGITVTRTIRDFQIILRDEAAFEAGLSANLILGEYSDVLVQHGNSKQIRIFAEADLDADPAISLQLSSEIEEELSFETYDSTADGKKIVVGLLTIEATDEITRDKPYLINFKTRISKEDTYEADFTFLLRTKDVEPWSPEPLSTEKELSVIAFPNPVKDFLYFDEQTVHGAQIHLVSAEGRSREVHVDALRNGIDLSAVESGIYLVQIYKNGTCKTLKIAKQ
jgi:hypothetical protein